MLLVSNNLRHDSFFLPPLSGLEATAIYLPLQNHNKLLFVAACLPPAVAIAPTDLDAIFLLHDTAVLTGDLNCKHVSWNNASVNKNGNTLLSYCLNKAITVNYPDQPTHFPYNSYPSVLDIALSQRCTASKAQSVPALSSDHNPLVFKVLLHPDFSEPRILYDYKHANWPIFRYSLDTALDPDSSIQSTADLDHAIDTFSRSVQQAAIHAIPVYTVKRNHLMFPPNLRYLLKLKNYYRHRYQRSRLPLFHYIFQLFTQIFSTYLTRPRNSKWSSFLGSLHTRTSQFWKVARYFTKSQSSIPPLIHQGVQVYHNPHKAEILAQQFERSHYLTLNMGTPHHTTTITRCVDRFFRNTTPHTSPLQLTNIYEVKRKILSLKLRSAPGKDGITHLILRHLSRNTLTLLTSLFNHLLRLGYFPTCWKRAKVVPIPKPNKPATDPNSYRPISLLITLGKLFERIIAVRLTSFVNRQHLLPRTQFGFRKKTLHRFPTGSNHRLHLQRLQSPQALRYDPARFRKSL